MEQLPQICRLTWQGIEIETTYTPRKWVVIAHLEIRSTHPARAPLPVTATGYRSHFHPCGTIEALGGDVAARVTAWLDFALPRSIGGYNPRRIAGSTRWSQHAFGNAIDIEQHGRNRVTAAFGAWARSHPAVIRDAARKHGIISGGDWRTPAYTCLKITRELG